MENRQRTIRKLLWRITAVLAVLAVVSICFVSGTFARYVSNRSGSTVTKVAKWDIDFTDGTGADENNFTVTVGKLSPSKANFPTPENNTVENRVKYSGTVLALKITNSGDVDAYLTITSPVVTGGEEDSETTATPKIIYYSSYTTGSIKTEYTDWGTTGFQNGGKPTESEANDVITMEFALTDTNEQPDETDWQRYTAFLNAYSQPSTIPETDDNSLRWLAAKDGEKVETLCVWARAVWTSQDSKYYEKYYKTDSTTAAAMAAAMSDGLDTWLGENIAAVGAAFTFSVVQASELPGTNP